MNGHCILVDHDHKVHQMTAQNKLVTDRAVPRAGPAGPRPEAPKLGRRKF